MPPKLAVHEADCIFGPESPAEDDPNESEDIEDNIHQADCVFRPESPAKDDTNKREEDQNNMDENINDVDSIVADPGQNPPRLPYMQPSAGMREDYGRVTPEQTELIRSVMGYIKGTPEGRQQISDRCINALRHTPEDDIEIILRVAIRICSFCLDTFVSMPHVSLALRILEAHDIISHEFELYE